MKTDMNKASRKKLFLKCLFFKSDQLLAFRGNILLLVLQYYDINFPANKSHKTSGAFESENDK